MLALSQKKREKKREEKREKKREKKGEEREKKGISIIEVDGIMILTRKEV